MRFTTRTLRRRGLLALGASLALGAGASPLLGQVANTSPAALGLSESFTAVARGYEAVAWNPAALGMTGGPNASATIGAVGALAGMGPVTLRDLADHQGETVPLDVRQRWLDRIVREGGQSGAAGFDFTWAAFQVGRFAAQVSSSGRTLNDISPGFAELILMGNADAEGNPRDIALGGAIIDANAYSTAAVSYGTPLNIATLPGRLAIGVTAKYTIGHLLAVSEESAGSATAEPIGMELRFPLAYTPVVYDGGSYWIRSGAGFGLDIAAAYEAGRLSVAVIAQNLVNTFEWNPQRLRYRPLEMVFSETTLDTDTEWRPFTEAPADLRALVDAATFNPSVTVGAALRWSPQLLVAADARIGSMDGMMTRPPVHAGAGVEYRPLPWLPLQAGAAFVRQSDQHEGLQYSGGLGLQLGSFHVSGAALRRTSGETAFMLSLLSHTF